MRVDFFSKHTRSIGQLVQRLEEKPRHTRIVREPQIPWPGTQDTRVQPDVLTFTPDPRDVRKTYLTYYEIYTGKSDTPHGKIQRQAQAWFAVVDELNKRRGEAVYHPRFVFWNTRTNTYNKVKP